MELGITLDPTRAVFLRRGSYDDGTQWQDFYYLWPSLDEDFVLTEGQRYAWFTIDEALSLADLAAYAREDLYLFRERLAAQGAAEQNDKPARQDSGRRQEATSDHA